MSVADRSDLPPLPLVGASPREVRAALHIEYRDEFDRDYRMALVEAAVSFDLSGVHDTVESWRCRSWVTRDRAQFRRMIRRAEFLLHGTEPPEDEPAHVTEAKLNCPCHRRPSSAME